MEFHIDFGNVAVPAAHSAPLLASLAGSAHALGADQYLFRLAGSGATHLVSGAALQTLDTCRAFASIDAQAARVAQTVASTRGSTVAARELIDQLHRLGLIVDAEAWLARIGTALLPAPLAPAGPVFIRACDRPSQLDALLATLADNERAHGARHRYVVLDDSRDAANVARHAASLAAFAQSSRVGVTHVDPAGWQRRVGRLAAALPHAARGIRFLLSGDAPDAPRFGGGKGYALAALLGAGTRYALLDDDFLLPMRRLDWQVPRLDIIGRVDAPARFFDRVEDALAAGEVIDGDPFTAQLAWCGAPLAYVWQATPEFKPKAATLLGVAPAESRWLAEDSRVIATCNGHRGSSGSANNDWLLLLPPEDRASLLRDEARYRMQLAGGSVWSGASSLRVLAQGHFTPFLVDGGSLVPPTMPGGRGEDLLFGMLCRAMAPTRVVLATPYTIGHRQEQARDRTLALREPETPGLNHFLNDWLGSRIDDIRAATPAARLQTVAAMLRDLAEASPSARLDMLGEYLAFRRADLVAQLSDVLGQASDAPAYWRADVATRIDVNRDALRAITPPRLAGWEDTSDMAAIAARFAAETGGFAEALSHWPEIWARVHDEPALLADA
jgi:hypothetical protein